MKLQNKVVWVTGSGRRLGRVIALSLAGRGARIGIHYNASQSEAAEVVYEIERQGGEAFCIQGDITSPSGCQSMADTLLSHFGHLDVLINNAAVFFKTPFLETTEQDWNTTLDTNLKGSFFCAQAAARAMQKNEGGVIINISDWAAERPYMNYLPYCISKAGVTALTKGLARTLAPKIRVNAIAPGPILLPEEMDAAERETIIRQTPLKKIGDPSDITQAVLFLLEGGDFMTGATLVLDGGRLIG